MKVWMHSVMIENVSLGRGPILARAAKETIEGWKWQNCYVGRDVEAQAKTEVTTLEQISIYFTILFYKKIKCNYKCKHNELLTRLLAYLAKADGTKQEYILFAFQLCNNSGAHIHKAKRIAFSFVKVQKVNPPFNLGTDIMLGDGVFLQQ